MLDSLRRIVQEVNAAHSLDEALSLIVTRVKAAMSADVCSVYITDDEAAEHVLLATDGLRPGAVGRVRLKLGEGLVGLVATRAEPVNVENAPEHSNFVFVAATGEAPFHGFLGVPILRRRRPLGVLVVQQREARRFTDDDESFLVTLAAQLAGSITLAEVRQGLNRLDDNRLDGTLFLEGVACAKGLGLGQAVVLFPETDLDSVPDKVTSDPEIECERFRHAVQSELEELRRLGQRMGRILSPGDHALFDAYALLLSSESLVQGTLGRIREGSWAPAALRDTIREYAGVFEEMDDPYLQGRSADIRDLGRRLLKRLQVEAAGNPDAAEYPDHIVLVGEEIGVSQLLETPLERLVGLVSVRGSGASHVALLARGLGVPAVFGVNDTPLARLHGREIVVDGYASRVCIQPGPALREEYLQRIRQEDELSRDLQELRALPSETPDGHAVRLMANTGMYADIVAARERGAEGIGLYRSEMHFFLRERFPVEEEQFVIYRQVLEEMAPQPVFLRTLDIGGDKPLPYFPIREDNPFLGWRGIRVTLDRPDIFKTQLRAMLRAGAGFDNLSIMLPMIATLGELEEALATLREVHGELREDGLELAVPRVGMMVEVPAVIYRIDLFAPRVDFLSVGTNDLTQYLLAVDRNNERVAKLYDSLNPSVLRAIRDAVEGARAAGRPMSVCGEMAGDPGAALLLMAMGVDCLSMSLGNLLKVKWAIRSVPRAVAVELLEEVWPLPSADAIRGRVHRVLEAHGLQSLVR